MAVDYSALSQTALKSKLRNVALNKNAFSFKSDLIIDQTSPIQEPIQRVLNVVDRARALHPSPDKREQLGPDGPACHSCDNVDKTTVIDNMSKKGMPRIVRDLIDLAIYLQAVHSEIDISGIAAFINRLEAMTSASTSSKSVFGEQLQRYLDDTADVDRFLDGKNPEYDWRAPLPEPFIERVIASYRIPDIRLVASIEEKLKSDDAKRYRTMALGTEVRPTRTACRQAIGTRPCLRVSSAQVARDAGSVDACSSLFSFKPVATQQRARVDGVLLLRSHRQEHS